MIATGKRTRIEYQQGQTQLSVNNLLHFRAVRLGEIDTRAILMRID